MHQPRFWPTTLKRAAGFAFVALLLASLLGGMARAQEGTLLYAESFDGGRAPGWELGPGWRVQPDGDNFLLSGEGHDWANAPPSESYPGDFRVQFRLKLLSGTVHLVYRMNRQGRYFIGFHGSGLYLSKQYWPDTFLNNLAPESGALHALDTWHTVEISGEGGRLQVRVNGQNELDYIDPDPLLFGTFAFETLDDGAVLIDDIRVYGSDTTTPPPTSSTETSWVRTGGPLGGLGYDVRMRPDNPDIMYVTDAWAGVFTSADGGHIWTPSNTGITTRTGASGDAIPVFSLTIDPHNYDTLWVGTQNVRGIFKSTDGGRTWVEKDHGVEEQFGITFRGFTVDPHEPNTVYAAGELSSWLWAGEERQGREFDRTQGVVYRTTDGGENWSAIWRGDNLARYVWVDPRDSNVIFISTGIFDREAADSEPGTGLPGGEGIVKSTDGGQTWTNATNGLNNLYTGSLFMHPDNPDILLAGTGNNQYWRGQGIYLSADGGASWQQMLRDENINAVEFAESDPRVAYAGSANTIYRSEDGGQTWSVQAGGNEYGWGPPGVRAGFPIDLQVDPRNPDRLFANNYGGGNFLSEDGGRTWQIASQGYTGAQVRDVALNPVNGRVYAAARSGLFATQDGGTTWTGLNTYPANALEWNVVAVDPANPQHVIASNNWNGQLLNSTQDGAHWTLVGPHAGEGKGWRALAFAPSEPATVYAGTSAFYSAGTFSEDMLAAGVFVSHDGGQHWAPANDALSNTANVTDLAVAPDNVGVVYAATGTHGLLKTEDGGVSWRALALNQPATLPVLTVEIHPTEPLTVFAGLIHGGILTSSDGGQSWRTAGIGLHPEASVSDLIFDPTNPQVLYAADRLSGIYRSVDGGATWATINDGLRLRSVNALAITPDGQHLYAAIEGEGVYRLDLNGQPPTG